MPLTQRNLRNRLARHLNFEQMECRRLMAVDMSFTQPTIEISGESQLMIELINRARANPSAEAGRVGIGLNQDLTQGAISVVPKQPLAPNQHLVDAALAHSEDMLDNAYFSHTGLNGSTPSARVRAAGYSTGAAENIAFYPVVARNSAEVVALTHDMFFRSAGHRQNLLSDFMRDVGIGVAVGNKTYDNGRDYSTMFTTENFGRENNNTLAITGAAFTDAVVDDDFYSVGEGMANILIEAVASTGQRYATRTGTAGGYALRVPTGQYSVRAFAADANSVATLGTVVVGVSNVKLDVLPEQFAPLDDSNTASPGTEVPPDAQYLDVNADGVVSPIDVLTIINHLNDSQSQYNSRADVNRDAVISPIDALLIVNHLNARIQTPSVSVANGENDNPSLAPRLSQLMVQVTQDMRGRFDGDWELVIESAKQVTWSNSSLDLTPGVSTKVPTPGYQIVARYGTLLMEYRAAEGGPLRFAGWDQVADYLADEDGFCCPWAIDAPCLEALDKALHAITVDFVHSHV